MRMWAYAFKLSVRPSVLLRLRLVICSMRVLSSDFHASSGMFTSSPLRTSSMDAVLLYMLVCVHIPKSRSDDVTGATAMWGKIKSHERGQTHLQAVPSLKSSSSSESCSCRTRLAARDCAGDPTAEVVFEAVVDATRERALRDIVLWLSRACFRRSRIVICRLWVAWAC